MDRVAVAAITFDFGNTLVRVDRPRLRDVLDQTADELLDQRIITERQAFMVVWGEERDRQFREDVPLFREADINLRTARVLARLRGLAEAPPPDARWDDVALTPLIDPDHIAAVVEAYGGAFVRRMDPVTDATATLGRLHAAGFRIGILSNWPLALTIDRFAEANGWAPFLDAIVVSQRVGIIKPHPRIFRAAEAALAIREGDGESILHVGDDWAADVVGGRQAGWRTAYVRNRQGDSPLPQSSRDEAAAGGEVADAIVPDLEIDELAELVDLVRLPDA
jgi:FMN phosphatase YigB (HAD superfamily)